MNAICPKHWDKRVYARKEVRFGPRTINVFGAKYNHVSRGQLILIPEELPLMYITINHRTTKKEEGHV